MRFLLKKEERNNRFKMRKITEKIFSTLFAALLMMAISVICASAEGNCNMQISPKNAGVGEKINVTVEFSSDNMDIQDAKANLEYDPTIIEVTADSQTQGSDGIVVLNGFAGDAPTVKFVITFTALKQGTTEISVTNSSATNLMNESLGSPTDSDTITIGDASGLEADSTLKSITLSEGQLSPAFSPDITSYTVNVENDVTSIEISAQMNSVKAMIALSGGFFDIAGVDGTSPKIYKGTVNLSEGDNKRMITVTAENGEETTYTVNVVRLASGEIAPIVTTPPAETAPPDETDDINIFQSSSGTTVPQGSGSTAKNPNDDNILNGLFPIIILAIFAIAIVLFVIVSMAKIQSEKRQREKAARRKKVAQQKAYSARQMENYNKTRGNQTRAQGTVKKKNSSNVRKPK